MQKTILAIASLLILALASCSETHQQEHPITTTNHTQQQERPNASENFTKNQKIEPEILTEPNQPAETKPELTVRFVRNDRVYASNEKAINDTLHLTMNYLSSLNVTFPSITVDYHLYRTREDFTKNVGDDHKNAIGIAHSNDKISEIVTGQNSNTASHELIHIIQFKLNRASLEVPNWYSEGMAEYLSAKAISQENTLLYDRKRNIHVSSYKEYKRLSQKNLSEIEAQDDFHHFQETNSNEKTYVSYAKSFLAVELLAELTNDRSIMLFYQSLNDNDTWEGAFEQTFKMPIKEFYALYEKYQKEKFTKTALKKIKNETS